ncbi:MAG: hypothetical protein AABZ74_10065 [Cyanobacteriota bacterium]
MSNIKSKVMFFFVVFSLIFNFNTKGYSAIFETKKENTKIEIYSLDIKNTQTEFYQLFNNNQFKTDVSSLETPSPEAYIVKQIFSGYLNAFPFAIIGMILGLFSPFINFLLKNSFKDSIESYSNDSLREAILFSLFTYLGMSFGITLAIYNEGDENSYEKWEGNFWITFIATFSSTILFLAGSLGIAFLRANEKESFLSFNKDPVYIGLFFFLFPLYMTISGVIGYHLTKKEIRNKSDELIYNKKDSFAKIEELNKEFLDFSQKININDDKITFNVFNF